MLKTHTRRQVMYSLDVASSWSVPEQALKFDSSHEAIKFVAEQVSRVVGGCTILDSVGYWADVEKADREKYDDVEIGVEHNVQLQVKAEVSKEEEIEKTIVNAFVTAAQMFPELGINWVCGHKVTAESLTVSFNFSIKENANQHVI